MKIISLKAENYKRLEAVEITPEGGHVILSGKNAQGKTSVLDAIMEALTGSVSAQPIRRGNEKAEIKIDLGDYQVKYTVTEKNNYITVESGDGATYKSPRKLLDSIVGKIAFDPLEFSRMEPKKQKEILIGLNPELDFAAENQTRAEIYEERTHLGRRIKDAEGQLKQYDDIAGTEKPERVNIADIMNQTKEKREAFSVLEKRIAEIESDGIWAQKESEQRKKQLTRLEEEFKKIQTEIIEIRGYLKESSERADCLLTRDRDELGKLRQEIEAADSGLLVAQEQNAKADRYEQGQKLLQEILVLKTDVGMCSRKIDKIDGEKAKKLSEAKLPINGLQLTEDGILFNNTPYQDLAASEKLKVSFAMSMALNPKLRVVFIRDASLLDNDSRTEVLRLAQEKDYQVWMEITDDSGKIGIVIEEGKVKHENK